MMRRCRTASCETISSAVHVASTANRAVISQNDVFANTRPGGGSNAAIVVEGDDVRIESNSIHNNAGIGVFIVFTGQNTIVRGNDIFGNPREAVFITGPNTTVEQNTIHANATDISSQGTVQVSGSSAVV